MGCIAYLILHDKISEMKILTLVILSICLQCFAKDLTWITNKYAGTNNFYWVTNTMSSIYATNYSYPCQFEPRYEWPKTNIIIPKEFTGTIQVGTNFYHVNTITNISYDYQLK